MGRKAVQRFSQDQIDRANSVSVVEYARSQGMILKKSGEWYKAENQGGLYFKNNANTWHWETQDAGGRGAISLCMKLEGKTWKEAVKTLLNEEMDEIRYEPKWEPEEELPKEFILPPKNNTYKHVFAYLIKHRGIDADIVKTLVDKRYIYENTKCSCVFVGKDKDGNAKHASVRSTNTDGRAFKQDVAGSKKAYSFSLSGVTDTLNVCEAPIDVLSYMTLQKLHGIPIKDSYVALGGVTDKSLERFLADHPDIKKIRMCTDHDEAGEGAAKRVYEKYNTEYKITRHRPRNKDFNEDLVVYREKEALQANGISEDSIQWYEDNRHNIRADTYSPTGNTTNVFVCTDYLEAMAIRDIRYKEWIDYSKLDGSDQNNVIPRDHYMISSGNNDVLLERLKELPAKKNIYICAGQSPKGELLKTIMKEQGTGIKYQICSPQSDSFQSDLAIMNAAESVVQQSEQAEMEQAAGLEL